MKLLERMSKMKNYKNEIIELIDIIDCLLCMLDLKWVSENDLRIRLHELYDKIINDENKK